LRAVHRVAVEAQQPISGILLQPELRLQFFLQTLRARTEQDQLLGAARALQWQFLHAQAVVALEIPARPRTALRQAVLMEHHRRSALVALKFPAALLISAADIVGEAATVEQQQDLPAVTDRFLQ